MTFFSFCFAISTRNHSLNELVSGKSLTKKKSKKEFFVSNSDSKDTNSSQSDSSLSSESSLSSNGDKNKQKVQIFELQILVLN